MIARLMVRVLVGVPLHSKCWRRPHAVGDGDSDSAVSALEGGSEGEKVRVMAKGRG